MATAAAISEHEAALYDRQIRLWGLDAQQRLRSTSVLVIGIRGLSAEITKNIVLAGAGAVTLVDETKVTLPDLGANFFLTKDDIAKTRAEAILPRVQALNPLVNVQVSNKDFLQPNVSIAEYNVIVAVDLPLHRAVLLDDKCRHAGIPFVTASSYGFFSTAFIDADKHRYYEMKQETVQAPSAVGSKKRAVPDSEVEKKEVRVDGVVAAPSLKAALDLPWNDAQLQRTHPLFFGQQVLAEALQLSASDLHAEMKKIRAQRMSASQAMLKQFDEAFLEKFARNAKAEISASCAIVGGIIGQEVIKLVTAKDEPLHNFLFFDGWQDQATTELIPEKSAPRQVAGPVVVLDLDDD